MISSSPSWWTWRNLAKRSVNSEKPARSASGMAAVETRMMVSRLRRSARCTRARLWRIAACCEPGSDILPSYAKGGGQPKGLRLSSPEPMERTASDGRSLFRYFLLLFGLCLPVWVVGPIFDIQLFPGFKLFQAGLAMPMIAALLLTHREHGRAGL